MNCREIQYYLNDYLDGGLPDEMRDEIKLHLIDCIVCSNEYEKLKSLIDSACSLPENMIPPTDLWQGIEKRTANTGKKNIRKQKVIHFHPGDQDRKSSVNIIAKGNRNKYLIAAGLAAIIIIGLFLSYLYQNQSSVSFWEVENLTGSPETGEDKFGKHGLLKAGEWLETDSTSWAVLKVGSIGEVEVEPFSKLQLVKNEQLEYRMQLEKGKIHAKIWAPPGMFFVETPAATAIDLGCSYSLSVQSDSSSLLKVTSGWVALKSGKREVLLPKGSMCRSDIRYGPGTPYFEDANNIFIDALSKYDLKTDTSGILDTVIFYARKKDVISLWHLIPVSNPEQREKLYRRIDEMIFIPESIDPGKIINADKEELNELWDNLGYGSKKLWDDLN